MRRWLANTIVLTGTAAMLATGTVMAYADWSNGAGAPVSLAASSAGLPAGPRPAVWEARGYVRIGWTATTLPADTGILSGYVVLRHSPLVAAPQQVCRTPRPTVRWCLDVPGEGVWTYTVQPALGPLWVGDPGPGSRAVTVDASEAKPLSVPPVVPPTAPSPTPPGTPLSLPPQVPTTPSPSAEATSTEVSPSSSVVAEPSPTAETASDGNPQPARSRLVRGKRGKHSR